MRIPAWLTRMSARLKGAKPVRVVDTLWLQMWRGEKADGTLWPNFRTRKDRYLFAAHQNKRERRRRMRQAYRGVLAPSQFWNFEEYREAREMHLVVVAADAKAAA